MAPRVWIDKESRGRPPRQRSCLSAADQSFVAVRDLIVPEADREAFAAYMGTSDHRRSHERIPTGQDRPSARGLRRYEVIAP